MDIKLITNTGEIYLNDKLDIEFYTEAENDLEVIQKIVLMLNIRQGELPYNVKYGLSWAILFEGHGNNIQTIKEHVRNQILKYFDEVDKIFYIEMEWSGEYMRALSLNINFTLKNGKGYGLEGVHIFG